MQNNRLVSVHCAGCYEDMTLFWLPSEMASYQTMSMDANAINDFFEAMEYDGSSLSFSHDTLCCDKPLEECQCKFPIIWDDAVEAVYEIYDDMSDLYEYANNLESKFAGSPSCLTCEFFCRSSCPSLRDRLYELLTSSQNVHVPIRVCAKWKMSQDSLYSDSALNSF